MPQIVKYRVPAGHTALSLYYSQAPGQIYSASSYRMKFWHPYFPVFRELRWLTVFAAKESVIFTPT